MLLVLLSYIQNRIKVMASIPTMRVVDNFVLSKEPEKSAPKRSGKTKSSLVCLTILAIVYGSTIIFRQRRTVETPPTQLYQLYNVSIASMTNYIIDGLLFLDISRKGETLSEAI